MAAALRVLNLDDNDAARYLRSRGLMRSGFEVIEAASGGEALEIAQGAALDVAVLDVKLPDMSGLEVTQRLKADPMTSAVRIVQVSSVYLDAGTELESLRHGADIFLRLPVEDAALSTVVTTLAGMRAAQAARFPNFLSHAAVNEG